jgi:hypothetical protein
MAHDRPCSVLVVSRDYPECRADGMGWRIASLAVLSLNPEVLP